MLSSGRSQPALFLALAFLIGTSSYLFWAPPFNWLWPLLWLLYLLYLRAWPAITLMLAGALYCFCLYSGSPSGQIGYFSIASKSPYHSPFQKGLIYKGMLYINHQRIPCNVALQNRDIPADRDYILKGHLLNRGSYNYLFKAKEWIPVEKTFSLAEMRYQAKEKFRNFLNEKLHRPRTATFLSSLITGDVEDRSLRFEFGRLGLQHILAISGFHFAILIAFCSFFLSLFLPHRWKIIALLLAINLYFLFVGSVPAVQRSWLTALLYLLGKLTYRHSTGLNLLGVALFIEVLLDPLVSSQLGFQLSFLSCAGILLFVPFFEQSLLTLLPKHTQLPLFSQHIYLLATFLRKGLAVNLAVNLAILPLILTHFHQFPLLSLLYNLFFPFLVGAALFTLLITLLIHILFAPLAAPLFTLVDFFTAQLLDIAAYPPIVLAHSIRASNFPALGSSRPISSLLFCLSIGSFRARMHPNCAGNPPHPHYLTTENTESTESRNAQDRIRKKRKKSLSPSWGARGHPASVVDYLCGKKLGGAGDGRGPPKIASIFGVVPRGWGYSDSSCLRRSVICCKPTFRSSSSA